MVNLNYEDLHPAFFGLSWLYPDFKYRKWDEYFLFTDNSITLVSYIDVYYAKLFEELKFNFDNKKIY